MLADLARVRFGVRESPSAPSQPVLRMLRGEGAADGLPSVLADLGVRDGTEDVWIGAIGRMDGAGRVPAQGFCRAPLFSDTCIPARLSHGLCPAALGAHPQDGDCSPGNASPDFTPNG